jgi:hypothetical protein
VGIVGAEEAFFGGEPVGALAEAPDLFRCWEEPVRGEHLRVLHCLAFQAIVGLRRGVDANKDLDGSDPVTMRT